MSAGAAEERAELTDDVGGEVPGRRRDRRRGVGAEFGVLDDLPATRANQGVDPHHVALVPAALDADPLALRLGRLDHRLPREVGCGRVDTGRRCHRLAVPQQLRVGPEDRRDQLTIPEGVFQRCLEHPVVEQLDVGRIGDREEISGVGELGDEGWVETHQVDGGIIGREPADELFALLVCLVGQDLRLDAEGAVGGVTALLGQLRLATVVRVDVPRQRRRAAGVVVVRARRHGDRRQDREREQRTPCPARGGALGLRSTRCGSCHLTPPVRTRSPRRSPRAPSIRH